MSGLWMTLMLVFLVSGGSAVVDQNQLARLIRRLTSPDTYELSGTMFCMALSIPSADPKNLAQILRDNPKSIVENTVKSGSVHKGRRLVVAEFTRGEPDHAEYKVLRDLQLESNAGDLLVIFSFASPCTTTCTNPNNEYRILPLIEQVIQSGNWGEHVFVFRAIFIPPNSNIDESVLATALQNLGNTGIGLQNIFRCFKPNTGTYHCTSCSSGGSVAKECVDRNAK